MKTLRGIRAYQKKNAFLLFLIAFLIVAAAFSQQTYTVGETEYYYGQTYETTRKPKVKRSQANKQAYLRSLGYTQTPVGYEVDHIIPLSQGGSDSPSNMQLLTVQQHRIKTARERRYTSTSTYSTPPTYTHYNTSYTPPPTYSYYSTSTYCPPVPSFDITPVRLTPPPLPSVNTYSPALMSPSYLNPGLSSGRTLYTGSRGGTYYINANGNKTYVKRN
jgi:hypothetical protein